MYDLNELYPVPAGHWRCPTCGEDWYLPAGYCKDCFAAADDEAFHQAHIAAGKATWSKCFNCVWKRAYLKSN